MWYQQPSAAVRTVTHWRPAFSTGQEHDGVHGVGHVQQTPVPDMHSFNAPICQEICSMSPFENVKVSENTYCRFVCVYMCICVQCYECASTCILCVHYNYCIGWSTFERQLGQHTSHQTPWHYQWSSVQDQKSICEGKALPVVILPASLD